MLRALSIRNFVIVDRLDLEFEPGFTVLTGETGAGKSILVDALSLVLGERSDGALVRINTRMLPGESVEAAMARLTPFAGQVVPLLNEYIPQ